MISKGIVLLADDNKKFLDVRRKFLEEAGYTVITAHNPEAADGILEGSKVDLAILDLRLKDDQDPLDKTGLELAMKFSQRAIPIIILTGFPTWEDAKVALGKDSNNLSPAIDYLSKNEGPDAMIQAVEWALENPRLRQIVLGEFQAESSQALHDAIKNQKPAETVKIFQTITERVCFETLQNQSEPFNKHLMTAMWLGIIGICVIFIGALLLIFGITSLADLSDLVSIVFVLISIGFEIASIWFVNRASQTYKHVKFEQYKEQKSYGVSPADFTLK